MLESAMEVFYGISTDPEVRSGIDGEWT